MHFRRAVPAFVLAGVVWASPLKAQPDTTEVQGVPVVFARDTLFQLTERFGAFSPEERAQAIVRRLRLLVDDPTADVRSLTVEDDENSTDILIHGRLVMTVTDRDAEAAGRSRIELAEEYGNRMVDVLTRVVMAATWKSLLLGALYTLIATAIFFGLIKLLNRFFPLLYRWLRQAPGKLIPPIRIQSLEIVSGDKVAKLLLTLARGVRVALYAVLVYIYLSVVFSFFPWTRGLGATLFNYVLEPLRDMGLAFVSYIPDLIFIAVVIAVTRYLLKFIHLLFNGVERGAITLPNFHAEWAEPTYKIVRFIIIVFAAVVIFPYLPGSSSPAFQGISIFVGVLFTLGSTSAIANIVAGVVIVYMRPFRVGDRVKIADTVGDVIEKTLLVTRVRTPKNMDVTVPNAMVLSSHIINYSSVARDQGVILHTTVTIGYDVPWQKVHGLLLAAARNTDGILEHPDPFVWQTKLDDWYVHYELNAYTDKPNNMGGIYSALHASIQDRFNEAGVEIMSPGYQALRDGNQTTIPEDYLPKGYRPPGFRIFPRTDQG